LVLGESGDTLIVRLDLAYQRNGGEAVVDLEHPASTVEVPDGGLVLRDRRWESALRDRFARDLGVRDRLELRGPEAVVFLRERLDALRERWDVWGEDALVRLRVRGELEPRVGFSTGEDWFDLDVRFEVDGRQVPAAPVLRSWLAGERLHRLDDGTLAVLPERWLDRHGRALDELRDVRRAQRRLGSWHAWMAAEILEAEVGEQARPWLAWTEPLRRFDGIPTRPAPSGLRAELRAYQQQGFEWLCFLRDAGLHGVLADDMGLGKTVQALAAVLDTERGRPSLVVAPTSVVPGWAAEAARFAPALRVQVHHGSDRGEDFDDVDLVVTTYGLLRRDRQLLERTAWRWVILDEAQHIKNPASKVARAARALRSDHRLALTGTPLENHLVELWSLMAFLMPGYLGSRRAFHARYAGPVARNGEAAALGALRQRLKPFVLRRTKDQVTPELPRRTDIVVKVPLAARERRLYDRVWSTYRASARGEITDDGLRWKSLHLLDALTRLRQACCHPALLPFPEARSVRRSSKVEALLERLLPALEGGHKALVFSQWPSLLRRVADRLDAAEVPWLLLEGATRDRGALVATFQSESGPPVFLISIKAGGTGLNLTAADLVFHLDPWWNPATEDQATDRAHRIGQTRPVTVYRLVASDTVEERVLALQDSKRGLFERTIDAERLDPATLSLDDLEAVLGPPVVAQESSQ
jgi:SNF2 family DNA or RNA helicase